MNDLIVQCLQQVLRINANTDRAAFFDFSGHVNKMQIWIAKSKTDYTIWMNEWLCWGDDDGSYDEDHLKSIVSDLQSIS